MQRARQHPRGQRIAVGVDIVCQDACWCADRQRLSDVDAILIGGRDRRLVGGRRDVDDRRDERQAVCGGCGGGQLQRVRLRPRRQERRDVKVADVPQVAIVARAIVGRRHGVAVEDVSSRALRLLIQANVLCGRFELIQVLTVTDVKLKIGVAGRIVDTGERRAPAIAVERVRYVRVIAVEQIHIALAAETAATEEHDQRRAVEVRAAYQGRGIDSVVADRIASVAGHDRRDIRAISLAVVVQPTIVVGVPDIRPHDRIPVELDRGVDGRRRRPRRPLPVEIRLGDGARYPADRDDATRLIAEASDARGHVIGVRALFDEGQFRRDGLCPHKERGCDDRQCQPQPCWSHRRNPRLSSLVFPLMLSGLGREAAFISGPS